MGGEELTCCICGDGHSQPPNQIVICDICAQGFHQSCHNPKINDSVISEVDTAWSCKLCDVMAKPEVKQTGNSCDKTTMYIMTDNVLKEKNVKQKVTEKIKKDRSSSDISSKKFYRQPKSPVSAGVTGYTGPKTTLSYELRNLRWSEHHLKNNANIYCYCAKRGDWYWNMIQCQRCKQWFHEECMSCLPYPLYLGDRFYLFVCGACNDGQEYLRRVPLNWDDVTHLMLFYLSMRDHLKYLDIDEILVPWLIQNWKKLQLPQELMCKDATASQTDYIRSHLLTVLQGKTSKYKNGREVKKRYSWWALRIRYPPCPPKLDPLPDGPISDGYIDQVLHDSQCTKRPFLTDLKMQVSLRFEPRPRGDKRKASDTTNQPQNKKRKTSTGSKTISLLGTTIHTVQCSDGSGCSVQNPSILSHTQTSDSPAKISLDRVIPCPSNFFGLNHPFKTVLEHDQELQQVKMKEKILLNYSECNSEVDGSPSESFTDSQETGSDSTTRTESVAVQAVKKKRKPTSLLLENFPRVKRRKRGRPSKAEILAIQARTVAAQQMGITDSNYIIQNNKNQTHNSNNNSKVEKRARTKNVVDKSTLDGMSEKEVTMTQLKSSVTNYFGAANRLAAGEGFKVLARRVTPDGKCQYLVEWKGGFIG